MSLAFLLPTSVIVLLAMGSCASSSTPEATRSGMPAAPSSSVQPAEGIEEGQVPAPAPSDAPDFRVVFARELALLQESADARKRSDYATARAKASEAAG